MSGIIKIYQKINARILFVMLILVAATALVVSLLNYNNLRRIYEKNFTERALLSNALIATLVDGDEIKHYVKWLTDRGEDFKKRQLQFYNDREELLGLLESGTEEERQAILLDKMKSFHYEMSAFKSDLYWEVVENLKLLRELSKSKYVYVFADTGVVAENGEKLYTYIFDADDDDTYDEPDSDGLGTVNSGEEIIEEIYLTKKPMDYVLYYKGSYGELYFAYAPVLDKDGNVSAILGTDVDLGEMHRDISNSMFLFSTVFLSFSTLVIIIIYIFLNRYITRPLHELTDTAQKLADGDVYTFVPDTALKQKSELGMLAQAVNEMSGVYQSMIKSSENLFSATKIGRLEVRNDASKYKGGIQKVIQQINYTLDAMTLYLNGVPEGIFIMSMAFEVYFRNEQFIRFFGDMPASEFMVKVFPEETEKQFARVLKQPDNYTAMHLNELCFSVTFKEITLSESGQNSVLVIAINITELMLEQEKAQAAARAKSDFLSRMSHEMRTPMNAIIGMTKIAENTDDISRLKYCLSTIGTSSRLLLGIINDILDMSKIEAGKFELENIPFNIEKMLEKINNIVSENMEKKSLNFMVNLPNDLNMDYSGDELRLSQVITNLLSNAIKFTAEHGTIILSVRENERQGESSTLHFSISDTGIGMTKEQISRLFSSFEQADGSITRRFGGTGLGLAISKSIVEKMGGFIWVESEYGKGSVFNFTIKLERSRLPDSISRDAEENELLSIPDFSDINILLAEDVEINREIFLALLEATGVSVDIAENGIAAVSKFRENPNKYDLIIMDIQMPEMDGYEATKTIRTIESKMRPVREIPIVAMTANAFKEDIERCLECGMNDHLSKPIDEKAVIEKILQYSAVGKT